jgi:hypothetical protein
LRDAWQASKDANKPWQIWTGATVVAPHLAPSLLYCGSAVSPANSDAVQEYCNAVLVDESAGLFRAAAAMEMFQQPWNADDFGKSPKLKYDCIYQKA